MGEKSCKAGENYAVINHRAAYRVLFADTDAMGIVYYGEYLRLFEYARLEFFRSIGVAITAPELSGYGFPAVEAHCRYLTPAVPDDLLVIEATLDTATRAAIRFDYRVLKEEESGEETLVATGHTVHACMDSQGRVVRPPRFLRERIDAACAFAEKSRPPKV